ncbi:hypothetical protein ACVMIH_007601 [Bradyrhizobium sp. USDA 4503]
MARECRKMCGDIGLPSKLGLVDPAWEAARRTMCVALRIPMIARRYSNLMPRSVPI